MFDNGVVATTGRELLRRYYSLSSYYLCAAFSPLLLNEDARAAYLSFANTNSPMSPTTLAQPDLMRFARSAPPHDGQAPSGQPAPHKQVLNDPCTPAAILQGKPAPFVQSTRQSKPAPFVQTKPAPSAQPESTRFANNVLAPSVHPK